MSLRGAAAAVLVAPLVLAGCDARQPGPVGPTPTGSLAAASTTLLPPEKPRGLHLEQIVEPSRPDRYRDGSRVAVYAEPDPLASGRLLVAVYREGSDSQSRLKPQDPDNWIIWERADDPDQERDEFAVTGWGLSRDELEAARRAAVFNRERGVLRIDGNGVPDGLEPVGVLPVRVGGRTFLEGVGTSVVWSDLRDRAELRLTLVDVDVRLVAALVRGERTALRGRPGVVGVPLGGDAEFQAAYVWSEGDTVAAVHARNLEPAVVEAFIQSLRPAGKARLAALRATIVEYPPELLLHPEMGGEPPRVVASGRTRHAMWVAWVSGPTVKGYQYGVAGLHVRAGPIGGSQGSLTVDNLARTRLLLSSNLRIDEGTLVAGAVAASVTQVRLKLGNGDTVELPVRHSTDPEAGWFGHWVEAGTVTTVEALDASGSVVARHPG